MSYKPPNGPPPSYSYSYVYPTGSQVPNASTYSYVQTPVMMPVPMPVYQSYIPQPQPQPQQPTASQYVTNHVYHQPSQPEPVRIEEVIDWANATRATAAALSPKAFVAGTEEDKPLWVIRAHHCGEFVPGKYSVKNSSAYIPYGGKEVSVENFEVLLAQPHLLHWLPSNHGQVPLGAFPAGNTAQGEPLYIARVKHTHIAKSNNLRSNLRCAHLQKDKQTFTISGKMHPSHGCCYISFRGSEISYKEYEVLCKVTK